ncbi:MAG: ABC transporter ATP-binding protein [Armatimonadota bacterium]
MDSLCIRTRGLAKRFGVRTAVDGLDLEVGRGQTFGFLGPNGSGKSTTIRMLLGLIGPTAGEAFILGHCVRRERLQALARVGALVETPAFYQFLTARENVRLFGRLSAEITEEQIVSALRAVGLEERMDDRVRTFSHGMKQRLGLACALVADPELVILDEPTNGLDPEGVKEVRDLIRSLAESRGMTVFLSSHLLHEVEQVCTHVAVISRGRLQAAGPVSELVRSRRPGVEFEVDRPDAALEVFRRLLRPDSLSVEGRRVRVSVDESEIPGLNRALVNSRINVSAIERRRQTLEDFYLDVMHREGAVH